VPNGPNGPDRRSEARPDAVEEPESIVFSSGGMKGAAPTDPRRKRANARRLFWYAVLVLIVVISLVVLGVGALVTSLMRVSRDPATGNVLGLLVAALLGPFYWMYYAWVMP
jgi:hypothetical protein